MLNPELPSKRWTGVTKVQLKLSNRWKWAESKCKIFLVDSPEQLFLGIQITNIWLSTVKASADDKRSFMTKNWECTSAPGQATGSTGEGIAKWLLVCAVLGLCCSSPYLGAKNSSPISRSVTGKNFKLAYIATTSIHSVPLICSN